MEKTKYVIGIIIITLFMVACSYQEQEIKVFQRIGSENKYEVMKVITDKEQVQTVRKMIDNINWEIVKFQMERPPDYKFAFQPTNAEVDVKTIQYQLWISPNKDKVGLHGGSRYYQLNKENSAIIFEILTGEKISNANVNE
ncbi:hypothetical protein [Lederbergia graminis]|uniref:YhfM-like domain-containing protein n=1 Tax=Lederbergia graminis TaxID=735518 RepID=A0ABW0LHW6_9BACI